MSFPNPNGQPQGQPSQYGSPGAAAMGENLAQRAEMARNVQQARYEMEGTADMFSRMSKICFFKCVSKFQEPDLGVGEMACLDRCVKKYMDTVTLTAAGMSKASAQGPPQ